MELQSKTPSLLAGEGSLLYNLTHLTLGSLPFQVRLGSLSRKSIQARRRSKRGR